MLHYPRFLRWWVVLSWPRVHAGLFREIPGLPSSPLWPPKDAPLFSPASRSLWPGPSLSDTSGPLWGQRFYSPARAAERRIQGTHRPPLPKSVLNPHRLCWLTISHKYTWEKPSEPLNLTRQRGLFRHHSPCCSAGRATAMPVFLYCFSVLYFCKVKSHLFSGRPALTLPLVPFRACLDSESSFKASGSDTSNVSMPFGYSPWAIPFPEPANGQDPLAATRKGLSAAGTLKNPIC